MITEQDVLNWVFAHVSERAKDGFPEQLNDATYAYAVGLYEGYYSALLEYGNTEIQIPEESHIKEL